DLAWDRLGLKLEPVGPSAVVPADPALHGGLKITAVRPTIPAAAGQTRPSPAAQQKLQAGDILVALPRWETLGRGAAPFPLGFAQGSGLPALRFVVVRGNQVIKGEFVLAGGGDEEPTGPRRAAPAAGPDQGPSAASGAGEVEHDPAGGWAN